MVYVIAASVIILAVILGSLGVINIEIVGIDLGELGSDGVLALGLAFLKWTGIVLLCLFILPFVVFLVIAPFWFIMVFPVPGILLAIIVAVTVILVI